MAVTTLRVVLAVVAVLAACRQVSAQSPPYRLDVLAQGTPPSLMASERALVSLTIRNSGTETWKRSEPIRLSYHWADSAGAMVVFDGLRTAIPRDVEPGEVVSACATVLTPRHPGRYQLQWDAVYEDRFWFSHRGGVAADPAPVDVGRYTTAKPRGDRLATVAAFWTLTLAPVLVTAVWLRRRSGNLMPSWDDYAFDTTLLGFGHLFIVLHLLVFTVGLSLGGVALALLAVYAAVAAWLAATPSAPRSAAATASADRESRISATDVVGLSVVLVLLVQWLWQASASADVAGTDAAHYHVPHAVNFLRGLRPTDYAATPHLYPMGTSVWAAWFMLPFDGPLLVDLATFPAFVLLAASSALIFRLVTNRSGLSWIPWLVIVAFSGFLPRLSLLMSADLSYAAGVLAVTATVLRFWRDQSISRRTIVAAGLAAGWLLGAKSTGLLSLSLLGATAVFIGIGLYRKHGHVSGLRVGVGLLAIGLAVAAGGLWLLRNWLAFGSPIAPYGARVFGLQILAGPPTSDYREYLSVVGDMKRSADYAIGRRFLEAIVDMFGPWLLWVPAMLAVLPVDAALQLLSRRPLSAATGRRIAFVLGVALAFAVHAYVIAGLPWTSLDWTRNLSLRYLLPFYFLLLLAAFSVLFTDGLAWDRRRSGRVLGWTLLAAGSLWHATRHTDIGNLPVDAWLLVIDSTTIVIAATVAVVLLAYREAAKRVALPHGPAAATCAAALVLILTWHGTADGAAVEAASFRLTASESSCLANGVPAASEHRGLYLKMLAYQESARLRCERMRFFLASRFDRPLDLQDAHFRNGVIDLSVTLRGSRGDRTPKPGGCDVVVARTRNVATSGENRFDRLFGAHYVFTPIASYGRFEAYVRQ